MSSSPRQNCRVSQVHQLRKHGGKWLRERREQVGLSQRELAERVGADHYTLISQLETGRGRIPPERYMTWAAALDLPPQYFVQEILRFYDPVTFQILFSGNASASAITELPE